MADTAEQIFQRFTDDGTASKIDAALSAAELRIVDMKAMEKASEQAISTMEEYVGESIPVNVVSGLIAGFLVALKNKDITQ